MCPRLSGHRRATRTAPAPLGRRSPGSAPGRSLRSAGRAPEATRAARGRATWPRRLAGDLATEGNAGLRRANGRETAAPTGARGSLAA